MKSAIPIILLLVSFTGCSQKEEEQASPEPSSTQEAQTAYGSAASVKGYLESINPYIQEVGAIQAEIDGQIGSAGVATSSNLAATMKQQRPRLQTALDGFTRLTPPPLLTDFHEKIEKLMKVRLAAYDMTISGWQREKENRDTSWHEAAESKLQEANDLILQLNGEMQKINMALAEATQKTRVATP